MNTVHFDTPGQVDGQRLSNWQSFCQNQDKLAVAKGEALELSCEELGRAEGLADMLKMIANTLDAASAGAPPSATEAGQLVILRIRQLLETMTARERLAEPKAPPTEPSTPKQ